MIEQPIEDQRNYWGKTWAGRIDGEKVSFNQPKFKRIMDFLWSRPQHFHRNKLDVGCGPATHTLALSQYAKGFAESWMGVDLAESAIEYAKKHGMNAHCVDFLNHDFEGCEPFETFYFWDSLEHFESLTPVADKIRKLAAEKFIICGNVPLFVSPAHGAGAIEMPMSADRIKSFLLECGCKGNFWQEVFGTFGIPFLMFEATN